MRLCGEYVWLHSSRLDDLRAKEICKTEVEICSTHRNDEESTASCRYHRPPRCAYTGTKRSKILIIIESSVAELCPDRMANHNLPPRLLLRPQSPEKNRGSTCRRKKIQTLQFLTTAHYRSIATPREGLQDIWYW